MKLSIESALRLASELIAGQRVSEAARTAGVGRTTAYRWLALGRGGDARFAILVEAIRAGPNSAWMRV